MVVNRYQKKVNPDSRQPRTDQTDAESAGVLRHSGFAGVSPRPLIKARPLVADRQAAPEIDKAFRAFVDKATKPAATAAAA